MIREKFVCISATLSDDPRNGAHTMTKGMDGRETGRKRSLLSISATHSPAYTQRTGDIAAGA
jgi:hypothetical protein